MYAVCVYIQHLGMVSVGFRSRTSSARTGTSQAALRGPKICSRLPDFQVDPNGSMLVYGRCLGLEGISISSLFGLGVYCNDTWTLWASNGLY